MASVAQSRLKEAKEMLQVNAVPDSRLDPVKDTIRPSDSFWNMVGRQWIRQVLY